MSAAAKELCQQLLVPAPGDRPTASQALRHGWLCRQPEKGGDALEMVPKQVAKELASKSRWRKAIRNVRSVIRLRTAIAKVRGDNGHSMAAVVQTATSPVLKARPGRRGWLSKKVTHGVRHSWHRRYFVLTHPSTIPNGPTQACLEWKSAEKDSSKLSGSLQLFGNSTCSATHGHGHGPSNAWRFAVGPLVAHAFCRHTQPGSAPPSVQRCYRLRTGPLITSRFRCWPPRALPQATSM